MRRLARLFVLGCLTTAILALHIGVGAADPRVQRVHLDVRVDPIRPDTEQRLRGAGLEIELAVPEIGRWQGWLSADRLDALRKIEGVIGVSTPRYASFAAGAALTEGDEALNASTARRRFNVDGSGVRIAVISDGITGLLQAQLIGEAPKLVDALSFGGGQLGRGQEGTAMIEIVHDLAPGAEISFAAVATDLDLIAAVNYYAQRVDIIVDDISFAYPGNQRSDVSVNTAKALDHPTWPLRLYVTAAGNWAESHWAGDWRPGVDGRQLGLPSSGAVQQFGGAHEADGRTLLFGGANAFRVEPGDRIRLTIFWDDHWGLSTNDYDLYLLSGFGDILASSESRQGIGPDNHNPREYLEYAHRGEAADLFAVIQNVNDDARPVKFDMFAFRAQGGLVRLQHHTPGGSILAQSDVASALTVGAVSVGQNLTAPYSSRGPTANGEPKPDIAAVDQVTVSNTTRYAPRFTGSSAAAPHVAGIAALLLEAQPALLANNGGSALIERRLIRDLLVDTALDVPPAGHDLASGAGLVDAEAALRAAVSRTAVVTSAADSGPGTLRAALSSGASIVLFNSSLGLDAQTISVETPLPPISEGTIVDGTGWTIDASAVDVGLALSANAELWGLTLINAGQSGLAVRGDSAALYDVRLERNRIGIRVTGTDVHISRAWVRESESHGALLDDGARASLSASTIEANGGAGVFVAGAARGAVIGPTDSPPNPVLATALRPQIDPLISPPTVPRSGRSFLVSGTVSLDGVPAQVGAKVDLYLDRRLAASVRVGADGRFFATVTGPGSEVRFAVEDFPLDQRILFEAGGKANISLRAVSASVRLGSDRIGSHIPQANVIRDNRIGIELESTSQRLEVDRIVWGNKMHGNAVPIVSPFAAPVIEQVAWTTTGINVTGIADAGATAHLYVGPLAERRFAAATTVVDGRFQFQDIDVDEAATHVSVIAHTRRSHASAESRVHRVAATGRIESVTPDSGYVEGGETVTICGSAITTDTAPPTVWFGSRPAHTAFWGGGCVTVTTPSGEPGAVDIALLLKDARPIVGLDAFIYRPERIVALRRGWNSVIWSGSPTRADAAFAPLQGRRFRVYAWNAETQEWRIYATELPQSLNTLRSLAHDQPLWFYLDGPGVDWRQPSPG